MDVAHHDTLARRLTSRKFLLFAGIEIVASAAMFTGFITGALWGTVTLTVLAGYGIVNTATHWSQRPKPAPQIDLPRLDLPRLDLPGIGNTPDVSDDGDNIDPNAG